MVTDTVADFLARMQNAVIRQKEKMEVPSAKMLVELARILKEENMVEGYEVENNVLKVKIAYVDGNPVVTRFVRKSKPGQRVYVTHHEILPVMNGRGISVVSTSKGVMTGAHAKHQKLGGELICEIW